MPRLLVVSLLVVSLQACASTVRPTLPTPTPIPVPVPQPVPIVVPVPVTPPTPVDPSHVRAFGYWLDGGRATANHTNVIDIQWPDNVSVADTDASWDVLVQTMTTATARGQKLIIWTPFFAFGPTPRSRNGYYWAADGEARWQARIAQLRPFISNVLAFSLLDEPDMVAWRDMAPGGPYDPNLYNDLMGHAMLVIRATFPGAPIAFNYGAVVNEMIVPDWATWIGLEAYGADLATFDFLKTLERKLSPTQGVMIMPEATLNATTTSDAVVAQWAREEYAAALLDPKIIGLRPFMWCIDRLPRCDDSASPSDPTYMVGGDRMPLSRAAFIAIGRAIGGTR